jgi:hypothetical protein
MLYLPKKISIVIHAHLDDIENYLREENGAVYWTTGQYQVERRPDGKYDITYQDMLVHQEVGSAPGCRTINTSQKIITIDNVIWTLQRDKILQAIITPEGEQRIIDEIRKKETELFLPATLN